MPPWRAPNGSTPVAIVPDAGGRSRPPGTGMTYSYLNEGRSDMSIMRRLSLGLPALAVTAVLTSTPAAAQAQKPNILVIMGDDIGYWNISAYNRGMMGYRTPNIDRIANEGALFTDYYGQQSCTAGRSAFITGQSPMRTGLLKVGLPGAKEGLSDRDPT